MREVIEAYYEALLDTDRDRALEVVRQAIQAGVRPEDVIFSVLVPSIEKMMAEVSGNVGTSLAQHFMAAQIATEVVDFVVPLFETAPVMKGTVVIGTASGDFHGLGKRIVAGCLKAHMVEVVDLGLSVPAERFVEEAVARDAQVIAISAMMVHTARGPDGCVKVRALVDEGGLGSRIKIAVGGAPFRFNPDLYTLVGADGWAENGIEAGRVIVDLIREVRGS